MEPVAVGVWLTMVIGLSTIALPLSSRLFPRGEAGAYSFTVALVVIGVVAHLVGHLAYRLPAMIAGVLGLVGLAAISLRGVDIEWRQFGYAVALFTGAFLFMVLIRAASPSAGTNPHWVGEMFLDFGLLNTLERADQLPPEDMWFAGETVRYHYGGQLLTSLLGGLTDTPPALAYNLGLATFFASLVTMAWGVARSIARPIGAPAGVAGALGVFLVAFAGNLVTALKVGGWLLPRGVAEWIGTRFGLDPAIADWSPGGFFYWDASRVIDRGVTPATEFPLFSWLHGDLHAHVLVKPVLLLLVALLVAYWFTPPERSARRSLLLVGAIPPVVGFVAVMNIWSFPVVIGLVGVTLVLAPGRPLDQLRSHFRAGDAETSQPPTTSSIPSALLAEGRRILEAVPVTVGVAILAVLWTLPYWMLVVLRGPGESLALWQTRTVLPEFLVVQGPFIVGFGVYLFARVGVHRRVLGLALGLIAVVLLTTVLTWAVSLLALVLLLLGWASLRVDRGRLSPVVDRIEGTRRIGPEGMLIVAGLGIVLVVEVVMIDGDPFNTVFKPYADVWQLWGVALAVVLARLYNGWPMPGPEAQQTRWSAVMYGGVILLVLSMGMYAALAVPAHVEQGNDFRGGASVEEVRETHGYTLDARAYVDVLYPAEAPAIEWIDDREGKPTIVTAVEAGYSWEPQDGEGAAAPSSLTGVPTVLGWHHEEQYRGAGSYEERYEDVRGMYLGDPATQRDLLAEYDVDYIYHGPVEENRWPNQFDADDLPGVTPAAEFDHATIYAVDLE